MSALTWVLAGYGFVLSTVLLFNRGAHLADNARADDGFDFETDVPGLAVDEPIPYQPTAFPPTVIDSDDVADATLDQLDVALWELEFEPGDAR